MNDDTIMAQIRPSILADLLKDKARLDWLELTAHGILWHQNYTGLITRAAIDAAMEASK